MSQFTPALDTALAGDDVRMFGALKIALPGYNLCLLDGASELSFGGDSYLGEDPVYGVWADVEGLEDGAGDQAPNFTLTLHPPDGASAAQLSDPAFQGSTVSIFIGALDAAGAVVADPYPFIVGELDVPRLITERNSRELEYDCVSAFERFFEIDDGMRLSPEFHKSIWPGENGFDNIHQVLRKDGWGIADGPPPGVANSGGYGGGKPERTPFGTSTPPARH